MVNINLFGNKVFVDIIKNLEMRRSSWIIQAGLKSNEYPDKRNTEEIHGNIAMEAEIGVIQPHTEDCHQKLGEHRIDYSGTLIVNF